MKACIVVRAIWDAEAEVWVATSDDVPGLVTEAATHAELVAKLEVMIPDLLSEDAALQSEFLPEVPLIVVSEQQGRLKLRAA